MEEDTVPCGLCSKPTRMTGTKRCDACYELESRIQGNPTLASEILGKLKGPVAHYTDQAKLALFDELRTALQCLYASVDTCRQVGKLKGGELAAEADARRVLDKLPPEPRIDDAPPHH